MNVSITPEESPLVNLTLPDVLLGAQGEVKVTLDNTSVYVPFALPHEEVLGQVRLRRGNQKVFEVKEVIKSSPERQESFCPHFTRCGGCQLQHLNNEYYQAFKKRLVVEPLAQKGIHIDPECIFWGLPAQRRRVTLSYRHERSGLRLGFYQRNTDYLVDVGNCPLLVPELNVLLKPIKEFFQRCVPLRAEGFVHLTATPGGVDLSWSPHRFRSQDLTPELWSEWAAFAHQHNIARITRAAKDLILQREEPYVKFSPTSQITFPAAAFLQPSLDAEQAMVTQMLSWIKQSGMGSEVAMADLFCGLGTFSFPLKEVCVRLLSADCDGPSIQELKKQSDSSWKVEQRDLFTSPLSPEELNEFDLVVLDPPRAGAFEQVQQLAQSKVSNLIMIACDVGTLARDAAFLVQSGWHVKEVRFLDQFPHTTHVEVMAWLSR